MKKTMLLASAAIIGVSFLAVPAKAQGVPQTVAITKVDVQKVAAGYLRLPCRIAPSRNRSSG